MVAAAERVAAVRALRQSGADVPWNLAGTLPAGVADRPPDADPDAGVTLLPGLAHGR